MTTPVCTVDGTGIHVPTYADCLAYFTSGYQSIYGADTYLGPDSQDGQFIAILALALSDANAEAVSVYNSFSPATAQGTGLSSVVKVNGIARYIPTYSSVSGLVVGQAGTTVSNGIISDGTNQWLLPASVTIPLSGQISVTVTATSLGAVLLSNGQIDTANGIGSILTPTLGWQSFLTTSAVAVGAPVEPDAALRQRQSLSTELPSQGILPGIVGNVLALPGVQNVTSYENTSDIVDANGLPGHSFCLVVEGGDDTQIADTIALGRPCCSTYGSTRISVTDAYGLSQTISFQRQTSVDVTVSIGIKALNGFTAAIQGQIVSAVIAYINALGTGQDVLINRLNVPANLSGAPASLTYEIQYVYAARGGLPPSNDDVIIAFAEFPQTNSNLVAVALTS